MKGRFSEFVAIDWSGAIGERLPGIAVATCGPDGPPILSKPECGWSRYDIQKLISHGLAEDTLVGLDLGMSLPFIDCGAFFPGRSETPHEAKDLWALIDRICVDDPHLAASSFVDHHDFSPYFRRHGGREGTHFKCDGAPHGRGRFRVTEHVQAAMGCKPYSNFNLVGAAQVGKSSLTGMRLLNRLKGAFPVWPIDPLPETGSVVVEIYTSLAALDAGRSAARSKLRTIEELNDALTVLGSPPVVGNGPIDDHSSDALLTAAWLRKVSADPARWTPPGLTPEIATTEGWTFGAF